VTVRILFSFRLTGGDRDSVPGTMGVSPQSRECGIAGVPAVGWAEESYDRLKRARRHDARPSSECRQARSSSERIGRCRTRTFRGGVFAAAWCDSPVGSRRGIVSTSRRHQCSRNHWIGCSSNCCGWFRRKSVTLIMFGMRRGCCRAVSGTNGDASVETATLGRLLRSG